METLLMSVRIICSSLRGHKLVHVSWLTTSRARGPTIKELRTLCVALLHLFTLVCCCFNITDCGGENRGTRLHQHLTQMDAVAGSCTVQRSPARTTVKHCSESHGLFPNAHVYRHEGKGKRVILQPSHLQWSCKCGSEINLDRVSVTMKGTDHPSLSAAFTFTPKSSRNFTIW